MNYGSLFSGIGGLDLGLDRAGLRCRWQVEIDPFCRAVLAKHWPDVPKFEDVREVGASLEPVDLIAGGFPCQDVSHANHENPAGLDGDRSGLWSEFRRIIDLLRPRFALVENVSALLDRGLGRVLGDLAELGYDAEWSVVTACAVGAPHVRKRLFILAYPAGVRLARGMGKDREPGEVQDYGQSAAASVRLGRALWESASRGILGVAHGAPTRMDRARVHACGNAVVPQVAEWIGRRLLEVA